MKRYTVLIMISLLSGLIPLQANHAESPALKSGRMASVTLDIHNVVCPKCRFTIRKALQNVAGVQKVTVNHDSKTAVVQFDPDNTTVDILTQAATNAGYPVTVRPDQ